MKRLIIGSVMFFLVSLAHSEGAYLGADVGYGWVDTNAKDTAQTLANLSGETVSYKDDEGAVLGRLFLGYNFNENVGVELGYFGSGSVDVDYRSANGQANENAKVRGVDLSLMLRPSVSSGLNGLFLRAGGHYSKIDGNASLAYNDGTNAATYSASGSESGTGFLVGAGYDFNLDKNINARVSYTYLDSLGSVSNADVNVLTFGLNTNF